jgi:glycogen operon protein
MLLGGDELGRTQGGNNNAYCQDNEISWIDWEAIDDRLLAFTRELARLRREHPVFRRRDWFADVAARPNARGPLPAIAWFDREGAPMSYEAWTARNARSVQVFLNGAGIDLPGDHGERVVDETFLLLFHAHDEAQRFVLPPARWGASWRRVLDTDRGFAAERSNGTHAAGGEIAVTARSLWLLRRDEPASRHRGRAALSR